MDYSPLGGFEGTVFSSYIQPMTGNVPSSGILSNLNTKVRMADIIDGASNTLILFELAGRNDLYEKGKFVSANVATGGGWADLSNYENWLSGSSADGSLQGGPCLVNCSNDNGNGMYSFHVCQRKYQCRYVVSPWLPSRRPGRRRFLNFSEKTGRTVIVVAVSRLKVLDESFHSKMRVSNAQADH